MSQFSFTTDTQSEQYCRDIINVMMSFGISQSEALRRLNEFWKGQDFVGMDLRYHRGGPESWAKWIFYGPLWWLDEQADHHHR